MLGGHRPDVVIWLDEADGEWVTSTAFAKAPVPFLADYIAKHPLKAEIGRTWDRSLAKDKYLYDYSTQDRRGIALVTTEFPHTVRGRGDEVRGAFTDAWESSPFSDAYLNALAMTSIDAMQLGRGAATDYLAHRFLGARQGRSRLRARLARGPGHLDPSRCAARPAVRQARSRPRQAAATWSA